MFLGILCPPPSPLSILPSNAKKMYGLCVCGTFNIQQYKPVPIRLRNSCTTFLRTTSICLLSRLQDSRFSDDENIFFFYAYHRLVIPWYCITWWKEDLTHHKVHPIKKNVPYRLWSTVSNGLIQRDPVNPARITCRGGFDENNIGKLGNKYYLFYFILLALPTDNTLQ